MAEAAAHAFIESYQVKYEKGVERLNKDRGAQLTSCNFPAEHWKHPRIPSKARSQPCAIARSG
jgi:transposase-like protein